MNRAEIEALEQSGKLDELISVHIFDNEAEGARRPYSRDFIYAIRVFEHMIRHYGANDASMNYDGEQGHYSAHFAHFYTDEETEADYKYGYAEHPTSLATAVCKAALLYIFYNPEDYPEWTQGDTGVDEEVYERYTGHLGDHGVIGGGC